MKSTRPDRFAAQAVAARHTLPHLSPLSEMELTVLKSSAAGETSRETAKRLRKSTETVKTQRRAVIAKLKARNMCHALSKAYRLGILN